MGRCDSVFAQTSHAAPYEKIIQSMNLPGSETDPASKAQTYSMAANLHVIDGNLEKANERIQQALQLCRDQKLNAATPYTVRIAVQVVKQMDPDGVAKFLNGQVNHPNASDAFKIEILKVLSQEQQISGDFVASIATLKTVLDAVQKKSSGSIEEANALIAYGEQCHAAKLFDLGLEPLEHARTLAAKLNRLDASNRAAVAVAKGLLAIGKDKEAAEILIEQIESRGNSQSQLFMGEMQMMLSQLQTRLGEFDAAAKTIEGSGGEWLAHFGTMPSFVLSIKASNLFARAVAEDSLEATMPTVIKGLEEAIEQRIRIMKINQDSVSEGKSVYKESTDRENAPDFLSLAAFEAIAGMDDAAMESLERTSVAIDTMENFYKTYKSPNEASNDPANVMIADQRAAIAEIRQMILVRNGKSDEALVVAEQSRGEAQSELLERRMGIAQNTDDAQPIDIEQIQSIADSQKTTLVYFSLVHALDPATRGLFKKDHTVNSPQFLYRWVVRPQQEIKFVSQVLPVRINDLIAVARGELADVMEGADDQKAVQDEESTFVADASVARILTRSSQAIPKLETNSDALRQLHQLLIEPIEKWLPESPTETVTFVPQGNLFVLPFAALTSKDGEPLIAKHTISLSPSAKMLTLADQEYQAVTEKDNQGILIVGNPTMPSFQTRPDEPAVPLSPLPGAEAEANYIAELFDVKAICGDEADERSVVEAMQTAKYIHLATHGLLEAGDTNAQGYLSSLAFAPSENEDGFLTVRETMELDLHAEMAVLSGCDTGRGRISGDGVVGLVRGYLSSGVPTVVVSLWPVSDNSTAVLMAMYYKELLGGASKAVALRKAMLKTRERFASPHAWAAFTLYGYSR